MRHAALTAAAILAVPACSPRAIAPSLSVTEKDTVTETIRDTVVVVRPDSTILSALVECNEVGEARLKEIRQLRNSARAVTSMGMRDNRIEVKTVVDSLKIYLALRERYRESVRTRTEKVVEIREVNVLNWRQKALIRTGILSIVLAGLYTLFRVLIKPRLNGIRTAFNGIFKRTS